jgi:hypothetical protein
MSVSARHWRLLAADVSWNTTWGDYQWNLYEVYLYIAPDASGTKIAVSAVAESTKYSAAYPGANVYDGNTGTFWSTIWHQTGPQWVSFDCGTLVSVGSLKLDLNVYNNLIVGPKKLSLQYRSDNSDWATLATVDVENTTANQTTRTFTDLQAGIANRPIINGGLLSRPPQFGGLLIR